MNPYLNVSSFFFQFCEKYFSFLGNKVVVLLSSKLCLSFLNYQATSVAVIVVFSVLKIV
jgi:hypothetical protein